MHTKIAAFVLFLPCFLEQNKLNYIICARAVGDERHGNTKPFCRSFPPPFFSVYTVLEPAPGADGKDCLILTTSQDLSGSAEQLLYTPTFAGLSVSLAILKHLKDNAGWMSKRLILLIVDEESESDYTERFHLGVKAFVDDYHLHTLDLLER